MGVYHSLSAVTRYKVWKHHGFSRDAYRATVSFSGLSTALAAPALIVLPADRIKRRSMHPHPTCCLFSLLLMLETMQYF
jgi:hypothetical protein